jgi:hypothetical protein
MAAEETGVEQWVTERWRGDHAVGTLEFFEMKVK